MPRRKSVSSSDAGASRPRGTKNGQLSQEATARRNALIEQYKDFVEVVVSRLIRSMGLPVALKEDFISAAFLGLIEAASRFDATRGLDFRSYAYLRIRGAVVDHIRSACVLPGHAYRKFRALEAAQELREQELNKPEGSEKVSPRLVSQQALQRIEKAAVSFKLTALSHEETESISHDETTPEDVLGRKQECEKIRSIVATLPEKERTIIEQYYFHDRKLVDVAEQFAGLSKSWVSRLHDRALEMLREKLSQVVTDIAA